jgi:hypothetical protein
MGELINLQDKFQRASDNLICLNPWEFRRADWKTLHFTQMLKSQSAKLECRRRENCTNREDIWNLPHSFLLKGSMAYTIKAVYTHRENEDKMREVYYLMGLMDCMINQVNPILRTDILRSMYKEVFKLKAELNIHWHGPFNQVLLPIESRFYNELEYRQSLNRAKTLKGLYQVIREGTDEMFDILALEYVFYFPGVGG